MVVELNKIYNEDCLETMKRMPDGFVDLVIADPPYGVGLKDWDRPLKQEELNEMLRVSRLGALCFYASSPKYVAHIYSLLPRPDRMMIWEKPFTPLPTKLCWNYEPIFIWRAQPHKYLRDVIKEPAILYKAQAEAAHSDVGVQKPERLLEKLVDAFSIVDELIYDPFLGSGTTAMAAERLGRNWIGSEINPDYCKVAQKRIDTERAQMKLFDSVPQHIKAHDDNTLQAL